MRNILILLIFIVAISLISLGCVKEGIKIVKSSNNSVPVQKITAQQSGNQTQASQPAQAYANSTASNQTSNQTPNTTNVSLSQGNPTNADLAISDFLISTIYPEPGEEFDVSFKIKNSGRESIKDFEYSIRIMKGNDVKKSEIYTYNSTIEAGSTSDKIKKSFSLEVGSYELVLMLDSSNAYAEPDEKNNIKRQLLSVKYATSSNTSEYSSSGSSSSSNNQTRSSTDSSGDCRDSDGGANYEVKGLCADRYQPGIYDFCDDFNKLGEWRCVSGRCTLEERTCRCEDGRCIS